MIDTGKMNTFTLSEVSEGQEGWYQCIVTNQVGSATSSAAYVQVMDPPANVVVTTSPSKSDLATGIDPGASFTLECTADGSSLSFEWRRYSSASGRS